MITSRIETSSVSISPEEEADQVTYSDIIEMFSKQVSAFENFTKTDDLDSFLGLGYDEEIKTARELLSTHQSKIPTIKKQLLEHGDCLINEFNKENVSVEEKVEMLFGCNYGEDLKKLMDEIFEVLYYTTTTVPTSDSQSSS